MRGRRARGSRRCRRARRPAPLGPQRRTRGPVATWACRRQTGLDGVQVPASEVQQGVEGRCPGTGGHDEPVDGAEDRFRLLPSSEHDECFGAVVSGGAEANHPHGVASCRASSAAVAARSNPPAFITTWVKFVHARKGGSRPGGPRRSRRLLRRLRSRRRSRPALPGSDRSSPRRAPGSPVLPPVGPARGAVGEAVAVEDLADAHVIRAWVQATSACAAVSSMVERSSAMRSSTASASWVNPALVAASAYVA